MVDDPDAVVSPGGDFNAPVPTAKGGPDFGRFVDAVRDVQDHARAEIKLNEAGEEYLSIPEVVGIEPARATTILIKAREGFTPAQLVEACQRIYREFEAAYPPGRVPPSSRVPIRKRPSRALFRSKAWARHRRRK